MSITLAIPTWKQVSDVIFLVVAYYSVLVAPQYDWFVFGVAYYFGVCVALRSWWRAPRHYYSKGVCSFMSCKCTRDGVRVKHDNHAVFQFIVSLVWVLAPVIGLTKLLVTTGNSRQLTEDGA